MTILGSLKSIIRLALIEFFARCYGWGATSDYLFKIGDFALTRAGWPKISGRRGCPRPTILFVRKLGSFVWYKNLDRSYFRFVTMHELDRRTDGQTDGQTDRQILIAEPPTHTGENNVRNAENWKLIFPNLVQEHYVGFVSKSITYLVSHIFSICAKYCRNRST